MMTVEALRKGKINDLNSVCCELSLIKGETLFVAGDSACLVYIVREGTAQMNTTLELDSFIKYPISADVWELRKETKQFCYKLHTF